MIYQTKDSCDHCHRKAAVVCPECGARLCIPHKECPECEEKNVSVETVGLDFSDFVL